jgi:predicted lysophospholipase L1 biosynthesis ABC-type transport system permease subunit
VIDGTVADQVDGFAGGPTWRDTTWDALGAHPGWVVRLVLRQALLLAAGGGVAGALAALLATRVLVGLLFQVRATDPFTYTLIAALLRFTAAIAALPTYAPRHRDRADYEAAGGLRISGRRST